MSETLFTIPPKQQAVMAFPVNKYVKRIGDGMLGPLTFVNITTDQRDAITNPTEGSVIYNSTTDALNVYANGAWGAIGGGSGAPSDAQYVTLATDATLTNERVLAVNTTNLSLTDGGAGGNVTINTIQGIATTSAPQFARLGLGVAANSVNPLTITQAAETSGTPQVAVITGGAHTGMTASTEVPCIDFNMAQTKQFETGAITTQRCIVFQAPTYAFVDASTITNAATVAISGPPIAGTNATLTSTNALWIQSGKIRMEDHIRFTTAVANVAADYFIGRTPSTGFTLGVPSGGSTILSFNGAAEYTFTSAALDIANNAINWTANGTATAGNTQITRITSNLVINNGTSGRISLRINGVEYLGVGTTPQVIISVARFLMTQGTDVASAGDLTLGADGNTFEITGTTTVNAITTTNWQNGSLVILIFAGVLTVSNNTAGGANTVPILTKTGANVTTAAGSTMQLVLSEQGGTQAWREV